MEPTPSVTVVDPVPPVPPVVTDRAVPDDAEVRVLGRGDSFRAWVEERSEHPREFGKLRLGDCLRAMITGPRNELEKRVLAAGTDSAGGFTVPDILPTDHGVRPTFDIVPTLIDLLGRRVPLQLSGASLVPGLLTSRHAGLSG